MGKVNLESEALQISIYCNSIMNILNEHKRLSLVKVVIFSYLVKRNRLKSQQIYDGKHSTDLMYKSLSLLIGNFEEFSNSVGNILKSIHILNEKNLISLEQNFIKLGTKQYEYKEVYKESLFFKKAIEECIHVSDKQFLKEVLCSV